MGKPAIISLAIMSLAIMSLAIMSLAVISAVNTLSPNVATQCRKCRTRAAVIAITKDASAGRQPRR
jgi:hypothetical protein